MHCTRLAVVAAAALVSLTSSAAQSAPPPLGALGTATIDGVMGPAEWTNAAKVEFTVKGSTGWPAPAAAGSMLVMNDATTLFIAFLIPGPTPLASGVNVNFDVNADGALAEGDDVILLNPSIGFIDEYFTKKPPCPASASFGCLGIEDTATGGTSEGQGQMRNNGSFSFYEMSHPLNSTDDAHDFSLTPGDVIAITQYSMFRECDGQTCADSYLPGAPLEVVIMPFSKPAISSFSPAHGLPGDSVELSGSHFVGATSVKFGGVRADFEVASNQRIATAVPHGAKSGLVTVTTPGGTASSARMFVVDVPHPVIAPPTASPRALRAGSYATVTFEVTRSDNDGTLAEGKMTGDPSVAGKVLPHKERFVEGTASLRFLIPPSAKDKVLTVRLTIRWHGSSTTRVSRFRVH